MYLREKKCSVKTHLLGGLSWLAPFEIIAPVSLFWNRLSERKSRNRELKGIKLSYQICICTVISIVNTLEFHKVQHCFAEA